jgi:glycerol-3-phosphate dehydrogenase
METEILVIGGGATGAGVAWDAALRGYQVVLVERRDLTHGTTGRYHGLLHSGGRYAVKDPLSAAECIAENRILRHTHAHCIEDTGGFFIVTPEDEGEYPDQFKAACAQAGIPCTEIAVAEALRRERLLNPHISRVFELPDGSADSFLATHATVQAARQAGAHILTYHEVIDLLVTGADGECQVVGATVRNQVTGAEFAIGAAMTINAAGAWSGKIAALAGIEVRILPSKGIMLAMNQRLVNTVVNRCKSPADGDILVPSHTVCVIGTTSVAVTDPDRLRIETWEVAQMLAEGDKIVPGLSQARVLRAWAGVRPLFQETYAGSGGRDVTRKLTLLDHKEREGVGGLLTITGGKWTTFRLMAEATVDKAGDYLGRRAPCVTATTAVPGAQQGPYWLGHRLYEVERDRLQGELVCECELVTRAMIRNAARNNPTITLDDLRRDVRLGKGPCQGGFCTYRAVGLLHEMGQWQSEAGGSAWAVADLQSPGQPESEQLPVISRQVTINDPSADGRRRTQMASPNLLLRDFLQERWKGVVPILWGRQLKQERLDELIYLSLMNADHLPDRELASPMSAFYGLDGAGEEQGSRGAGERGSGGAGELGVDSQESTLPSRRPEVNSQQATSNSQQATANKQQPTSNSQQSTINNQQSTINNHQPTAARAPENSSRLLPCPPAPLLPLSPAPPLPLRPSLLIIGAGLAGLAAAYVAARANWQVRVVAQGWGAHHWAAGTVDVLGYAPGEWAEAVQRPLATIDKLSRSRPGHPYSLLGLARLQENLDAFAAITAEIGLPYQGAPAAGENLWLPSAVGAARPTYLAPPGQAAGDLSRPEPMLIVGFQGMRDFYPHLIAENLNRQGLAARAAWLPLALLTDRHDFTTVHLAEGFEAEGRLALIAAHLKQLVRPGERIGLAAILGLDAHPAVLAELERQTGTAVFEIPTLPPSVPGIRLFQRLRRRLLAMGVRVDAGMKVSGAQISSQGEGATIQYVQIDSSARPYKQRADYFLLATGGILGGGFDSDSDGRVWETIFDLPLNAPRQRDQWFQPHFLNREGHPIFSAGIVVNEQFQPLNAGQEPAFTNLWAAGNLLAHSDALQERSLEGVAVATGIAAARAIVGGGV